MVHNGEKDLNSESHQQINRTLVLKVKTGNAGFSSMLNNSGATNQETNSDEIFI